MQKDYLPDKMTAINKAFFNLLSIFLFVTVINSPALAHKVNIFAYVEGDTVFTESYFNDGRKCVNSKITVFDSSGNQLLEGVTNQEGEFSFKIPKRIDLRIVLTASMGHKNEYILPAGEFIDYSEEKMGASDKIWEESSGKETDLEEANLSREWPVDLEAIQSVVETALDKKLRPVIKSLAKIEHKPKGPSMTEVIGGIGYIFGIVGIIIYLRNRKK